MAGDLKVSTESDKCVVSLSGRVNFETVVPLREFVNNMPAEISNITVDLADCLSMDSTCMGVLSMMALMGVKRKLKIRLLNAGGNRQLLKGLGVEKLFKFEDGEVEHFCNVIYPQEKTDSKDLTAAAETVLQAHESLVDADSGNQQRFGTVIEMTRQDVERLKNK